MPRFELIQNDTMVAVVECNDERRAFREIMRYAHQYSQDGPLALRIIGAVDFVQATLTIHEDDV